MLAHAKALSVECALDVEYNVSQREAPILRVYSYFLIRHPFTVVVRDVVGHVVPQGKVVVNGDYRRLMTIIVFEATIP